MEVGGGRIMMVILKVEKWDRGYMWLGVGDGARGWGMIMVPLKAE